MKKSKIFFYKQILTIVAIGILAYLCTAVIHEGLGHGIACKIVDGKTIALASDYFDCNESNLSWVAIRIVEAGGTMANILFSFIFLAVLRLKKNLTPNTRYFCWLLMSINLFQAGGYLMVSPFGGFGDWYRFITNLTPLIAWQIGLTLLGLCLSSLAIFLSGQQIQPFIGIEKSLRKRKAFGLTFIPYLAGGITSCLASLLNPVGGLTILLIAGVASSFGGTAWLVWVTAWVDRFRPNQNSSMPQASNAWIAAGVIGFIVYVIILGRSIAL